MSTCVHSPWIGRCAPFTPEGIGATTARPSRRGRGRCRSRSYRPNYVAFLQDLRVNWVGLLRRAALRRQHGQHCRARAYSTEIRIPTFSDRALRPVHPGVQGARLRRVSHVGVRELRSGDGTAPCESGTARTARRFPTTDRQSGPRTGRGSPTIPTTPGSFGSSGARTPTRRFTTRR